MDVQLEAILKFATEAHGNQRRKFADEPYINHPIRVMHRCQQHTSSIAISAAALLHDVLEDTNVTQKQLESFLHETLPHETAEHTLRLVVDLTDVYTHESYPNVNRRKRKEKENDRLSKIHPDAQTVKYADIIDNSIDITNSGDDFTEKFLRECKSLLRVIARGNRELYNEALNIVSLNLRVFEKKGTIGH